MRTYVAKVTGPRMAAISNHETAATPACKSRKKQKLKFFVEHRSKMVKFGGCSSPPHHKVRGLWVQRRWSPCPCVLMPLAVALLPRAVPLAVQRWDWWPPRSPASRLVAFTTEKKKARWLFGDRLRPRPHGRRSCGWRSLVVHPLPS